MMEKVRLGDIFEYMAKSKIKAGEGKKEGKYKFFTSSNLQDKFIDEWVYDGEYLIFGTGGKASINYCNEKFSTSTDNFVVKVKKGINTKLIYLYFKNDMQKLEKGFKGASIKHISKDYINQLTIPLYELKFQEKIVKQLDKVQEIIDLRKKQIEELEELIRAQFVDMFGDIYDNKNNFIIKELDYYTSMITYGLTIRPKFVEKGIDLISAREINSGNIDYDKAPKISEDDYNKLSDKAKPKKNEILFSKTGTIGLCAIIDSEIKFAITQNAARIVPKENINPIWLLYYLRTDEIQSYCKRQAKGNAVKDFQIQDMKKIPILDCSISKQNEFVEKVKQIDKQKIILKKSLKETEELQESLMNKYFGE